MAYIITAVGAGGKTTYLENRAREYLKAGKKVVVTTTTHIWAPEGDPCQPVDRHKHIDKSRNIDIWIGKNGEPDHCGIFQPSGKLSALSSEQFFLLCDEYDVVLVEGDGSHCMPAKIPGENEPVIPAGSDEIVVVMGEHAIGRRIDVVCHRCALSAQGPVSGHESENMTKNMLREIAEYYYMDPLQSRYPKAKVSYVLSRMKKSKARIVAVVMASGFGRRYGGNKLLDIYRGRPLYRHALSHVTDAFGAENTLVVTQYEQIFNEVRESGVNSVMNDRAQEGIAASIRKGTEWALMTGADAVMFFAADMPKLPSCEIRRYAGQFLSSGKPYGCMVFGPEHINTNPGAFRLDVCAKKLLSLSGDKGAMRIMKKEPRNIYYYQIAPEFVKDVDTKIN